MNEAKNIDKYKNNREKLNILHVRKSLLPDLTLDEIYRIAERHLKNRILNGSNLY